MKPRQWLQQQEYCTSTPSFQWILWILNFVICRRSVKCDSATLDHHQSINTPVARMWRRWTSRKKFFSISFTKLALRHKKNEDVGRRQRALGHVIKKKFFRTCRGNCLSSPKSYSRSHGKTEEKARVWEGKTTPTDWKLQPNVRWSCGNFPWTSRALWWSAALMIFKQFYDLVLHNSSMNEWKHADGYTRDELVYAWNENHGVQFLTGVELLQFNPISRKKRKLSRPSS